MVIVESLSRLFCIRESGLILGRKGTTTTLAVCLLLSFEDGETSSNFNDQQIVRPAKRQIYIWPADAAKILWLFWHNWPEYSYLNNTTYSMSGTPTLLTLTKAQRDNQTAEVTERCLRTRCWCSPKHLQGQRVNFWHQNRWETVC